MQNKSIAIIKEALSFGLRKANEHIVLLISIECIFLGLWALLALSGETMHGIPDRIADPNFIQKYILLGGAYLHNLIPLSIKSYVLFGLSIAGWAIITTMIVFIQGSRKIMLDLYETNQSSLYQLLSPFHMLFTLMLATIFYTLISVIGLICFILPGVYLASKYGFYSYCLLDDDTLGPIEALKKSGQITKGFVNYLCFYTIIWAMLIYLAIVSFIGWILIIPVLMLTDTYLYRQLVPNSQH